ncbi:DUF4175 family protein [Ascidiimonas sp. W6]|uniref:DUF4175 family protein n=1 Tax=Ascidiimonas meishanensis TaxID=3128903 RepID=UPI0030EC5A2F
MIFLTIGVLYFISIVLLENFLWFDTDIRTVIFWVTVAIEASLFVKFILFPALQLFRLRKGLSEKEASIVLGTHFKDIDDRLLNIIQLSESKDSSELLQASIEQKSEHLIPIPFGKAVDYRKGLKYAIYTLIPMVLLIIFWVSGRINWFSQGYERVVNYNIAYEPPAPFYFRVLNDSLTAIENQEFSIEVTTIGDVLPDQVVLVGDGYEYIMQSIGIGVWEYHMQSPLVLSGGFRFKSGEVVSPLQNIEVLKAPRLISLSMIMDYPDYTGRADEVIKNNGNAEAPEGTKVRWVATTKNAALVELSDRDTVYRLDKSETDFILSKRLYKSWQYELITGSEELPNYERLQYEIRILKDRYPKINVEVLKDSSKTNNNYISVRYSDDYGVSELNLVYYDSNFPSVKKTESLAKNRSGYQDEIFQFPGQRKLKEGTNYQYYIEVKDNDGINGAKAAKSEVFSLYILNENNRLEENLEQQKKALNQLSNGLQKMNDGIKEIKSLAQEQKQKSFNNFNDKRKLQQTLRRQSAQQQMMKKFNKELENSLEKLNQDKEETSYEKMLKERLERHQKQLEKNERLMEELEKLAEKMSKEELSKKLDELSKQQQNSERSLEQVLELTKRYYVTAKSDKIQKELERVSEKQDSLSKLNKGKDEIDAQKKLNESFDNIKKGLEALEKENEGLKKPMELGLDKQLEDGIKMDQKQAKDELDKEAMENEEQTKGKQSAANKAQKKAGAKMKKLKEKMKESMQSQGSEGMQEDANMLRQILDNLVLFSFDQEALINEISVETETGAAFARRLREQNELRTLFKHVDDSLFALSLRRPEISDVINKEITEVYFNVDKALDRLSQNQIYQGVASQQYVLTAANNLADFLSNVLDNMQDSMGSGSGKSSEGFQLPDIIQSQQQLSKQMKEGKEKSNQGKPSEGKEGQGENGEENQSSKGGKNKGKEGKEGSRPGDGISEEMSEELFEMYKQQQQIREALENQLKDKEGSGIGANGKMLIRQMERIEQELLERGVTNRVLQQMNNLEHQLLKLENAIRQQGEKKERESTSSNISYQNPVNEITPKIKQYFDQLEILNRQVLPLRQIYKGKVNEYFGGRN